MHLRDVANAEADARKSLALHFDHAANAIRGLGSARRRHQLQRHVVEREQHGLPALGRALPRWRPREQRLVGRLTCPDIVDENDDVIETRDHGNSPRVFLAARTFSTPIAMAAVRCGILPALERASIWSKARSRM